MNVRSIEKYQLIFQATLDLVAEYGLHNAPMSKVSKQSGVSMGAIYNYFQSKEELISQLFIHTKQAMSAAVFEQYDEAKNYRDRFFLLWLNTYKFLIEHPQQLSFMEQCTNAPILTEEALLVEQAFIEKLLVFIQEGVAQKTLKQLDSLLMISLVYGAILGTAKLEIFGKMQLDSAAIASAAQASWDGLCR